MRKAICEQDKMGNYKAIMNKIRECIEYTPVYEQEGREFMRKQ